MEEVISRNEFDKSYLLIKREKGEYDYVYKMLTQNNIPGLLECKIRYLEETEYLAYNVTAKKTLERIFYDKKMSFLELTELFYAINKIMHIANEYLLDQGGFWIQPKYMYMGLDMEELYCLYFPDTELCKEFGEERYRQLADFLLDKIDHRDEHAVNLAYHFYKISKEEYFSFDSFIGFMEKECLLVQDKNIKQRKDQEDKDEISRLAENNIIMENPIKEDGECKVSGSRKWCTVTGVFVLGTALILVYLLIPFLHNFALYLLVPGITLIVLAVSLLIRNLIGVYKEKVDYTYMDPPEPVRIEEYFDNVEDDVTIFFDREEFLQLKWNENHFSKEFILEEFPVTVGKMKSSVQMLIEDASISRLHARFRKQGVTVYLQDLDSTNGTYVNKKQLFPGEEIIIKRGDEIQFGKIIVNVV